MIKKLSSKGQIVLPAEYRKSLGLKAGHPIEITCEGNQLILRPAGKPSARLVRTPGYARPLLSLGKKRVVRNRDIVDIFDDGGDV